ncbi:MobB family relaxase [Allomuricauda taeanensis]|uniref:MobB family relaxase n=1 Tax=Flagellimonas taeanensis TaxID=1005926 RepID=UPI002E7B5C95|nr:MobB family relaxase [Allomuricauda taeanensis]MEE1962029.1 MobB family relaxase [Allomuricauda taeanensis]
MYITITPQQTKGNFSQSVADYVAYLEKENESLSLSEQEHFFNQYGDKITAEQVISEIDGNTKKLSKHEPKFYAITVSPSKAELRQLKDHSKDLKAYTRELMKAYAQSFHREIHGRAPNVDDIKYFAKVEHQRFFKGTDREVRENQPMASKILEHQHQGRRIARGEEAGNLEQIKERISELEQSAPHQLDGKRIVQGMPKPGHQTHVHLIVSRRDASNSVSLSPGSKYRASEVMLHGKMVKRGFDRDQFFTQAEKVFDAKFEYQRNFVEYYPSRKLMVQNPKLYYSTILGLPTNEKTLALKLLGKSGVHLPQIPTNKVQLALKTIKALKRGVDVAIKSGSIGI